MEDISNKTLALLLAVAIVVSLVGIFTAQKGGVIRLSGHATDTSTVSFEQLSVAAINVTNDINFGAGRVEDGETYAYLDSKSGTSTYGNWSFAAQGILIENSGTVNLSLDVQANESSTSFVGGDAVTPKFNFNLTQEEASSCASGLADGEFAANDTDYEICAVFEHVPSRNALNLTIELEVPNNAPTGARQTTLTFTGTDIE